MKSGVAAATKTRLYPPCHRLHPSLALLFSTLSSVVRFFFLFPPFLVLQTPLDTWELDLLCDRVLLGV